MIGVVVRVAVHELSWLIYREAQDLFLHIAWLNLIRSILG